jgi:hypothetical protein
MLRSAKGADARRQTAKELVNPLGGALNAVTVLREFLNSAKGADGRRESEKEPLSSSRGARDAAPVLGGFLNSRTTVISVGWLSRIQRFPKRSSHGMNLQPLPVPLDCYTSEST